MVRRTDSTRSRPPPCGGLCCWEAYAAKNNPKDTNAVLSQKQARSSAGTRGKTTTQISLTRKEQNAAAATACINVHCPSSGPPRSARPRARSAALPPRRAVSRLRSCAPPA
eukprot:CAMPEP_0204292274 /NCGR_PEP_ID=MMETSP0468-20130131/64035_1 /ASSEMBLY_ACC=CAM_ASM_000383 /TAXON_ID=2969 /ORGANISM="Oxyrrhis marina" /LENGTH=110 /DNA_ID=CAMNT_0051270649 /DNA_START=122 /DNA_END=454 /DNA_ORIENTATION=-